MVIDRRYTPASAGPFDAHGSKQMVYEVYGDYVEGPVEDSKTILNYFGEDVLGTKKNKTRLFY